MGIPDEERGSRIKAFIVLRPGAEGGPETERSIQAHVRERLAPYQYPKELEFVSELPLTTTGKVQRKLLRERPAAPKS